MKIRVRAKNESFEFDCREGERILYAGLRGGLALPYECATGTCGTCKARVREPSTITEAWREAPGNEYLKRERGEFLMCQTCATADCEIAVPANLAPLPEGRFRPSRRLGRVHNARFLTHDVKAFDVELDAPIDYDAGQFVVLEVPAAAGFRAYSMVNYAPGTRRLEFVVKKKPGGVFSEWLFGDDIEGAQAEVFGPLGKAIFLPEDDKDILCIAGGSGIAGIMSILERGCREGYFNAHRGNVFFGVRTMKDAFYLEELSAFASRFGDTLRVTIALSEEDAPSGDPPCGGTLDYTTGFVHSVALEKMAGRYDETAAFVAGPPPMVDGALRMLIMEARLPARYIRYDKFG